MICWITCCCCLKQLFHLRSSCKFSCVRFGHKKKTWRFRMLRHRITPGKPFKLQTNSLVFLVLLTARSQCRSYLQIYPIFTPTCATWCVCSVVGHSGSTVRPVWFYICGTNHHFKDGKHLHPPDVTQHRDLSQLHSDSVAARFSLTKG